ncbi:MAG: glycosyltransferase family 9 protein [Daejeonella sp.]|uniref:glycosyltransferase family 9 protein n=1 Tax=Daejeonella sp. JGW-45 TaxID=3034148 RepID=UPI0023EC3AEC|nr:glycosyltransferase family 9 protein [Daejeonella sp. JGW-45]
MESKKIKILVIRFSSIGDIVLTTPVIRCLQKQVSNIELHYLTKKAYEPVLAGNPYIDKLHFLAESLNDTIGRLKLENFDHIIDLHHNVRTFIIKKKLGRPSVSFDKLNWQKWVLVNTGMNFLPKKHIVDRYMETVEFLGVKNDGAGLDYFLINNHSLSLLLPPSHQHYIALVIGAQHATKRLPTNRLIELCRLIEQPVVLLGGAEDAARGETITAAAGQHVFNGCGKFKLDQSAFLVKMAKCVITHDTGLMHIAAAFKKTILSVWGNTVPEFGMYPYMTDDSCMFEVEGLPCRPCSKIGYEKCPRGHFKCMNNIDLTKISQQANA